MRIQKPFDSVGHSFLRLLGAAWVFVLSGTAVGSATPVPTAVTIPGSFQSEVGCPDDWQPDCAATHLTFDAEDGVWQGTFSIPTGNWEYKAALNDSWDENYGANATPNGPNIGLSLPAASSVKFYYDHATQIRHSSRRDRTFSTPTPTFRKCWRSGGAPGSSGFARQTRSTRGFSSRTPAPARSRA